MPVLSRSPMRLHALCLTAALTGAMLPLIRPSAASAAPLSRSTTFTVTIENVSGDATLKLPDGTATKAPIAPGMFAVFRGASPFFALGKSASRELESLAEDGESGPFEAKLTREIAAGTAGMFAPGLPFQIRARPGDRLSFATMFVQSNDDFYGPRGGSIELFDTNGHARRGDLTGLVVLYDAGTEVDEPPGVGPNQAPRQPAPNTGPDEHGKVHPATKRFAYPPVAAVIRVTIEPAESEPPVTG